MSRMTREMFCLMEGRHVHPSTLYPGGVGTVPTQQLFTDYLVRLMKYVEFMKKVVPLHDDLFDFFYEALPGMKRSASRRVLPGCWGSFNDPRSATTPTAHGRVGQGDVRHTRRHRGRQGHHPRPGRDQSGLRILLGCSFYEDWEEGRRSSIETRWATRSTSVIHGTRRPPRGRRSVTSAATTPGSCRPAGRTPRPASTSPSTLAAGRSPGSGSRRSRASSTSATSRRPARA